MHKPCGPSPTASRPRAGRRRATTERRILQLQREAGNAGVAQLLRDDNEGAAVEQLRRRRGPAARARPRRCSMESAFGENFQDVRVHTGAEATASAQRLGANAYTVGNDVVFSEATTTLARRAGQRVLAHELAHVVQQRSGPVDGTDTGTGVKVSDPGDRFERAAEDTADRVTSGQSRGRRATRQRGWRGRAARGGSRGGDGGAGAGPVGAARGGRRGAGRGGLRAPPYTSSILRHHLRRRRGVDERGEPFQPVVAHRLDLAQRLPRESHHHHRPFDGAHISAAHPGHGHAAVVDDVRSQRRCTPRSSRPCPSPSPAIGTARTHRSIRRARRSGCQLSSATMPTHVASHAVTSSGLMAGLR